MITKSEIVEIHWIFKSLSRIHKRHVHETIRIVTPAQRCKINEIVATSEVLKSIGNMCIFWPVGSKSIVSVTFFGPPTKPPNGGTTTTHSGNVSKVRVFIGIIEGIVVILGKNRGGTANLNNNNIYI